MAYGPLLDDASLLCDLASKIVMHSRVVTASLIIVSSYILEPYPFSSSFNLVVSALEYSLRVQVDAFINNGHERCR